MKEEKRNARFLLQLAEIKYLKLNGWIEYIGTLDCWEDPNEKGRYCNHESAVAIQKQRD